MGGMIAKYKVKTLYHATSEEAWDNIQYEKKLRPGRDGMLGAGIYFAETPEAAVFKATKKEVILKVKVRVGKPHVVYNKKSKFNERQVRNYGCHSVNSRVPGKDPEWLVFRTEQIKKIELLRYTGIKGQNTDVCKGDDYIPPELLVLVKALHMLEQMIIIADEDDNEAMFY